MRQETTTRTLYQYDELTDRAKEVARQWFAQGVYDYEWWNTLYEDAKTIGLKITGFDLDRSRHAEGILGVSVMECCSRIIANHGKMCDTYKLAGRTFKEKREGIEIDPFEFTRELLEEYSIMLQAESEFMVSNEYLEDGIIANEYEFLEDGKRA